MAIPVDPSNRALADEFLSGLGDLLNELVADSDGDPPNTPGVYLFAEGDEVLHVGRTRYLRGRRGQQTSATGTHNSASAAFKLARANARDDGLELPKTRAETEAHPEFIPYFDAARTQLREADFYYVEIDDPPIQTIFEIYASIALGLPRELWLTH